MAIGKRFILFPLVLIVLVSGLVESFHFEEDELASQRNLWKLYDRWSKHHNISRNLKEKHQRFNVFKENAKHVFAVNQMNKSYKLSLNKFGDMSDYEFMNFFGGSNVSEFRKSHDRRREDNVGGFMYEPTFGAPATMDWRSLGAVNYVKNQESCGSCWAFSSTAAVESINQIRTKQMISLSEQELVDCDYTNQGCNGGYMTSAFEFIRENGGITTEGSYPYYGSQGACRSSQMNSVKVTIDGYASVAPYDENALMQAVANQPVSVSIGASGSDFRYYSQGVFSGDCGTQLNHAVLAIGYGPDYWLVKNSWGTGWGEGGYMRLQRGVNQCGISVDASYPIKY